MYVYLVYGGFSPPGTTGTLPQDPLGFPFPQTLCAVPTLPPNHGYTTGSRTYEAKT